MYEQFRLRKNVLGNLAELTMGGPTRFGLKWSLIKPHPRNKKRATTFDTDSCSTVYTLLVVAGVQSASLSPVPGKEIVTVAVKPFC
jgi:hypothetical protein